MLYYITVTLHMIAGMICAIWQITYRKSKGQTEKELGFINVNKARIRI